MAGGIFAEADADIIVRSSDGFDYKVHKLLLNQYFRAFDDMFVRATCLPPDDTYRHHLSQSAPFVGTGNAQEVLNGLPVVALAEASNLLSLLLYLLYPVSAPVITCTWAELLELMELLRKYGAKGYPPSVQRILLLAAKQGGLRAAEVYALACCHSSLKALSVEVAKLTLSQYRASALSPTNLSSA